MSSDSLAAFVWSGGAVPESVEQEAAELIAAKLGRLAEGEGMLTDPDTWRRVAARMGVHVEDYCVPGAHRGECSLSAHDADLGVLFVNTAYAPPEQAPVFVHELAHLELLAWIPPRLAGCADVYHYDDEPTSVHHRIAQRVEELVLRSTDCAGCASGRDGT
jgi:hypothetical protein